MSARHITDREQAVLLMARAGGPIDGFLLEGLTHEAEIKRSAKTLARLGLLRVKARDSETRIFLTREGFAKSIGDAA